MRNIKRILSMVLTVVVLFGVLAVPAGAVSGFKDSADIVNTEAVEITAGLGLFAGADGNFMPKGVVTRAQMATIIIKMLYGANADAYSFKKLDSEFNDIADFEGGWAAGYINWCAGLGIVAGYGDGTFKPGKTVTTAEALTMIINALDVDAGPGEWPMTIMAKAEEMKLCADLAVKPGTYDALTRDELAVIALAGLEYSSAGKSGWRIPASGLVFEDLSDAVLANGGSFEGITEAVGEDSLASKVYKMQKISGFLTANQATGGELTTIGGVDYNAQTGLDMIGHYVTVYFDQAYKSEIEPGTVYAIVDDSTVVTVEEAVDSAKEYKAVFGKTYDLAKKNASDDVLIFNGEFVLSNNGTVFGYVKGTDAPAGTYIIKNSAVVTYLPPATKLFSKVTYVDRTEGSETISLSGINDYQPIANSADDDCVREYAGIAADDYVVVTKAGTVWNISPVTTVTGKITRTGIIDGVPYVTLNGTDYTAFEGTVLIDELDDVSANIRYGESYTLYLTEDNEYIGWEKGEESSDTDLSKVRYLLGTYTQKVKDQYGKETKQVYAQGVNMDGKEVSELIGVLKSDGTTFVGNYADLAAAQAAVPGESFYLIEEYDPSDREDKKLGVQQITKVLAVNDPAYDEDTMPFFLGANRYATEGETSISFCNTAYFITGHICDVNCTYDFTAANYGHTGSSTDTIYYGPARFLCIDGELGGELEATCLSDTYRYYTKSGEAYKFPMLFSKKENGAVLMNAIIFRTDAQSLQAGDTPIYFSQTQLDSPSYVPEGTLYQGYDPLTGEIVELTFDRTTISTVPSVKGFYPYTVEDGIVTLGSRVTGNEKTSAYALHNYTLYGIQDGKLLGETTEESGNTAALTGDKGDKAIIIDTRTQAEINASGVGEITSLAQMVDMAENGQYLVRFDAYDKSTYELSTIFVFDVGKPKTGGFYLPGYAVAGANAAYTLDGEKTTLYVDNADVGLTGFVKQAMGGGLALSSLSEGVLAEQKGASYANGTITINGEEYTVNNSTTIIDLNSGEQTEQAALNDLVGATVHAVLDGTTVKTLFIKKVGDCPEHIGWTELKSSDATLAEGYYYLSGNVDVSAGLSVESGNVTLCLNGYTLTGGTGNSSSVINVTGGTLTICDCKGTGTIDGQDAIRGLRIGSGASVDLTGGAVTNGYISGNGGGVLINGTLTMSGNAKITDCEATNGGGVFVSGGCTFIMENGTIRGNKATTYGGGVRSGGTFTMNGGTIQENTSSGSGAGGVYNSGTFNMTAGAISDNTTSGKYGGGGIYASGTITLSGGSITGNHATHATGGNGGGVRIGDGGKVTMNEGVTVTGNDAAVNGDGVFVAGGNTFTMNGGTISGNPEEQSDSDYDLYYNTTSVVTLTAGTIGKKNR